jgi:hypothetical protein
MPVPHLHLKTQTQILCLMMSAVFLLILLTYQEALLVKQKKKIHVRIPDDIDEDLVSKVKCELEDSYSKVPLEYIYQKIDLAISPRVSRSRSYSQEAIDTMLALLVNPYSCKLRERQTALKVFAGETQIHSTNDFWGKLNRKYSKRTFIEEEMGGMARNVSFP